MALNTEIKETKVIVENELRINPKSRDNDYILICLVIRDLGYNWNMPFASIMEKMSNGELPAMGTITRCRRKLQEIHPELRGKNWALRNEAQDEYINLAKGEI